MDISYLIGIDLGTTNSAVSYIEISSGNPGNIRIYKIPQLVGAGEIASMPVLPSFLYIAGPYDIQRDLISVPWDPDSDKIIGMFARDQGIKIPARLVSSAKSWLCHSGVDRRAKILPWGAGQDVYRVSPVEASASYLRHMRQSWNANKGDETDLYFENQSIVLTVPASFDEAARDLTLEAANLAGLKNVTLLEEPLAAFYCWLSRHERNWSDYVKPGELILVCDVGGGTTDFTLIALKESEGSPRFERIAVGDHLILGGDNIDLALARHIESRFSKKKSSLTTDRWKSLCHQCRQAKESILSGDMDSKKIILMGEGSRLIADTLSAELTREEIEHIALEGFFPLVSEEGTPIEKPSTRKGITEFGLPYEPDPAITRHIGIFMKRHQEDIKRVLQRSNPAPDFVLFNGGALKPKIIQNRICEAIQYWFKTDHPPKILYNPDPDLAVAEGAAYYGLVKAGLGVRVGSGSARSFYLGVGTQNSTKDGNVPEDLSQSKYAICIVERGLDEGSHIQLQDRQFEVLANQPVVFDLYSSSYRSGDKTGDLIQVDDSMTPLPPIRTVIQFGKKGAQSKIPVNIEASYTEVGTLAIWCRSTISDHRWKLQFQLRDTQDAAGIQDREIFEASVIEEVQHCVRQAFLNPLNRVLIQSLVKEMSSILRRSKENWPLSVIRIISDELLEHIDKRTVNTDTEIRWLNLLGFCLRPGFGDGFDDHRIKKLWKIAKQGPIFKNNAQVRSEWWIMWRRVAGGLSSGQQRQFMQDITPLLTPKKGVKIKTISQEHLELWMALANMERILSKDKLKWGKQLLSEIDPNQYKSQQFWALSRFGARELLYGPADRVISPNDVSEWIEYILSQQWSNPKPVGNALIQIARKTGDRIRDIDDSLIKRIIDWLLRHEFSPSQIQILQHVIPIEKQEQNDIFGESLPLGIMMRT